MCWNRLICPFVSPYVCLYVRYESYFGERLLKKSILWRLNFCVFCLKRLIFLLLPKIANCLCYKSAAKCNSATSETTYLGSVEPKKKACLIPSMSVFLCTSKRKFLQNQKPEERTSLIYMFFFVRQVMSIQRLFLGGKMNIYVHFIHILLYLSILNPKAEL